MFDQPFETLADERGFDGGAVARCFKPRADRPFRSGKTEEGNARWPAILPIWTGDPSQSDAEVCAEPAGCCSCKRFRNVRGDDSRLLDYPAGNTELLFHGRIVGNPGAQEIAGLRDIRQRAGEQAARARFKTGQ